MESYDYNGNKIKSKKKEECSGSENKILVPV